MHIYHRCLAVSTFGTLSITGIFGFFCSPFIAVNSVEITIIHDGIFTFAQRDSPECIAIAQPPIEEQRPEEQLVRLRRESNFECDRTGCQDGFPRC